MEGFSFEGRNSTRSTRQGASRFNAAENKNNVSMVISPVCFAGYYIMSADYLETSYPHKSAKGLNLPSCNSHFLISYEMSLSVRPRVSLLLLYSQP